jgi:uncharacterized protein
MLAFADTSALVKLFLDEAHSGAVRQLAADASFAVCRVAWAEAMAGFARRARERPEEYAAIDMAKRTFIDYWPRIAVVEVSQALVVRAGEYADTFALRGYDAVQLAAAQELAIAGAEPLAFACFDARLNKAARVLGMRAMFIEA